jgi:hypothetical protein
MSLHDVTMIAWLTSIVPTEPCGSSFLAKNNYQHDDYDIMGTA